MVQGRPSGGWDEYQRLVLSELERLDRERAELELRIRSTESSIIWLQAKAGLWGFLAGMIPSIGALVTALALNR